MAEKGGREGLTRRSSYKKSLAETFLPPQYLERLEEKRKQLDESIHKYIAAKEREYKSFERDLRQQHKLAQGQDAAIEAAKRRNSPESNSTRPVVQIDRVEGSTASGAHSPPATGKAPRHERNSHTSQNDDEVSRQHDRSAMAGLKDRRASSERDKDFAGLFTPPYLSALDDRDGRQLERTSSAPTTVPTLKAPDAQKEVGSIERANSDSLLRAKPQRPSHLALTHQNSSSGSSVDGKLASAMKSPTQQPKRKRVSLAVGDSIVAPSDNVPVSLSYNSTPSHSRMRSSVPEKDLPVSAKESVERSVAENPTVGSSELVAEQVSFGNIVGNETKILQDSPTPKVKQRVSSPRAGPLSPKIDADGDLFGLEEEDIEIKSDQDEDEDDENAIESEEEDSLEAVVAADSVEAVSEQERYDPATGLIPEPEDSTDSAVPYLAFGPSSAIASQQPTRPGFRRPSVVHDPVYRGTDYRTAEQDAVENEIYGSSFNRPKTKGSFTAGSLGESFMAEHAGDLMKPRSASKQAQVVS